MCILRKHEEEKKLNGKQSINHPSKGSVQLNTSIYTVHLWPLQKWIGETKIRKKRSHNIHTETSWLMFSAPVFSSVKILHIHPHKDPNLN